MAEGRAGLKRFLRYWLPPLVWMAVIFPLGGKGLKSYRLYRLFMGVLHAFLPRLSWELSNTAYTLFRKSLHFFGYALLAWLLYRAFRAGRPASWKKEWALGAGGVAVFYGFVDEFLQGFVRSRNASSFDWIIDSAGIAAALLVIRAVMRSRDKPEIPAAAPPVASAGRSS
mgnify:CR=1 FL=1